jgi:hypothetical protein
MSQDLPEDDITREVDVLLETIEQRCEVLNVLQQEM